MSVYELLQQLDRAPGRRFEVKLPPVTTGLLIRRQFRVLLAAAELDGLDIVWREEKGLIDSVFLIRMTGPTDRIAHHLRQLVALGGGQ